MSQNSPTPWISVIMAAHNAESSICEAIQSVLHQTYKQFEFIIVDDGSTDNTHEIISSFPDPRIICLINDENQGLTLSLNKGINYATHDLIVRMDADDTSDLHRFETLVQELSKVPDVGVICSRAWIFQENNDNIHLSMRLDSPEEIYVHLQFKNCIMHSSVLMKREVLIKNGFYDESFRYGQDYELWNRLSKKVIFHQIPSPLVTWRAPDPENIAIKNERWEIAEKRIFYYSCRFFLGSWFHLIPDRWISTMKVIIGPCHQPDHSMTVLDLIISRCLLWILLRKILHHSPEKLDKKQVEKCCTDFFSSSKSLWKKQGKNLIMKRTHS